MKDELPESPDPNNKYGAEEDPLDKAGHIDPPPFFRTWNGMYGFVIGVFIVLVILLYLFTKAYE